MPCLFYADFDINILAETNIVKNIGVMKKGRDTDFGSSKIIFLETESRRYSHKTVDKSNLSHGEIQRLFLIKRKIIF